MTSTGGGGNRRRPVLLLGALSLAACGSDTEDLRAYVDEVKARPGGRIEPLPEIQPHETFAYEADTLRSPFVAESPAAASGGAGVRPNRERNREFLEQFPLDTLSMVGTLDIEGRNHGLVQTIDGLVHRVRPGNHLGQNDGRILSISSSKIELVEIVPDGLGGYLERPAAIGLTD
ncbi:MAG TPA: pilus assembly protein PilP [Gammaproteobacteria bacterium]|nr:pilus assembly protein PilP [Gammaproteobacteria bacterium]